MEEHEIEIIRYCAEINGPCFECPVRDLCQLWKEES